MNKAFLLIICLFFTFNSALAIDFSKFDVNDLDAARKATKYYQKVYKNKRGTKEADEDYDKFWDFIIKFGSAQNEKISLQTELIDNSIQKQTEVYSEKYYKYGLAAQFDEGEFMLVPSRAYLYENFAPYLSKPYQELLKFNASDARIIYDARYTISKSELENYLKFYEQLAQKYPEFSKKYDILGIINYYKEAIKHYPNIIF